MVDTFTMFHEPERFRKGVKTAQTLHERKYNMSVEGASASYFVRIFFTKSQEVESQLAPSDWYNVPHSSNQGICAK